MERGGEGTTALLALTHALHPQGRAGADGARGMPGEPGVKVTCLPPGTPVSALPTRGARQSLLIQDSGKG